METLKYVYNLDRRFFGLLLLWFVTVSVLSFTLPKQESFLLINSLNHPAADYFFAGVTQLADGLFIVILGIVFLFRSKLRRLGIAILVTYTLSGLICATLKRYFANPRPASVLNHVPEFHDVSWMPMAYQNSFPSGHTTSIFAAATTVALLGRNRRWSVIALGIACLAAYSRVYLAQHFVEDLWFGTLIGTGIAIICYLAYRAVLIRSGISTDWTWPSLRV